MRSRLFIAPLALALMVAGGCASMNEDQCTYADWYTVGMEDGTRGYSMSRLGAHRKACAKHAVTPDLERYSAGRDQGLQSFCTPANGVARGKSGAGYTDVCPAQLSGDFRRGWELGRDVYEVRVAMATYEAESAKIENRLGEEGVSEEEREVLARRLREIGRELGRLEADYDEASIRAQRII